jgi:vancomycin resistance protein VanW
MEVVERRCHSVDSYGEGRYFELGRDATIEYGYIDLRFRNPHSFSVVLSVTVDDGGVSTALRSTAGPDFRATIEVSPPRRFIAPDGARGLAVQTSRTLHPSAGDARTERLGESRYLEAAS